MSKKATITSIAIVVGLLHFVTGEDYRGPLPVFVNGYLIDILLPMTMCLLLGLIEVKWVRSTLFRAAAVFLFGCIVETSPYLGYPLFGNTFDPLDILAYAGDQVCAGGRFFSDRRLFDPTRAVCLPSCWS
jgi:hypothetical protein